MANHMEAIAKELGLELGEEFKIKGYLDEPNLLFRITLKGLEFTDIRVAVPMWQLDENEQFQRICEESDNIIKLPFEPKYNERYWYVCWVNEPPYVDWTKCLYSSYDYGKIKLGNCFHTKEEAMANKYRIYEELTGRKWKE